MPDANPPVRRGLLSAITTTSAIFAALLAAVSGFLILLTTLVMTLFSAMGTGTPAPGLWRGIGLNAIFGVGVIGWGLLMLAWAVSARSRPALTPGDCMQAIALGVPALAFSIWKFTNSAPPVPHTTLAMLAASALWTAAMFISAIATTRRA
ncbi:MAG: hypothetical protein ACK4WH_14595 [Phycisphaerales bacterium]